jgi:hypothetical protein
VGGAVIGGMGGEAAQYGAENVIGSPPAEPGTFGQRVLGAGLRTGAAEVVGVPFRAAPEAAYGVVRPAAEAAERLRPILEGTAPTGAGMKAAEALSPENPYLLARWWQENAIGKNPADVVNAWDKLGGEGIETEAAQRALAGPHYADVQTLIGTLRQGGQSWPQAFKQVGLGGGGGLGMAPWLYYGGHPRAAVASLMPAVTDVLAPTAVARGLASPGAGVPFLANLPRAARVAGPIWGLATRAAAQPIVYENWSPAASGEDWQPRR